MKKLRVLLLVDEDLVPPLRVEPEEDYRRQPWKMEYDIQAALRELGHEVRALGIGRDFRPLQDLYREWPADIAFTLLEDVYGAIQYDHHVISFLELLGLPYTGCNPLGLGLTRDKALTKKLLSYHRIRSPGFFVCRHGQVAQRPKRLTFPLIVKSLTDHASAGISRQSVVETEEALADRIAFIHETLQSDAIVEEFIPGREFYAGVLGNQRLEVFPLWELLIRNKPDDAPLVATRKVKWDPAYQEKAGVITQRAQDLPDGLEEHIRKISRRIYRILHISGYARLDFRLAEDGTPYLLEANANPQLAFGEDFAEAAECGGITYPKLIQRILNLGLRWHEMHAIA